MISSSLLDLVLNKYVLGSLAVLIPLVLAYYKGSQSAEDKAAAEALLQEQARDSKLRAAEAKNLFLEKTGAATNEKINSANTISELIGLFDQIQRKQSKTRDADSDS